MAEMQSRQGRSRFPMFTTMQKVPAGLMLIPLAMGVLVNTFAPMPCRSAGSRKRCSRMARWP